jgi:hypothetical protein
VPDAGWRPDAVPANARDRPGATRGIPAATDRAPSPQMETRMSEEQSSAHGKAWRGESGIAVRGTSRALSATGHGLFRSTVSDRISQVCTMGARAKLLPWLVSLSVPDISVVLANACAAGPTNRRETTTPHPVRLPSVAERGQVEQRNVRSRLAAPDRTRY